MTLRVAILDAEADTSSLWGVSMIITQVHILSDPEYYLATGTFPFVGGSGPR